MLSGISLLLFLFLSLKLNELDMFPIRLQLSCWFSAITQHLEAFLSEPLSSVGVSVMLTTPMYAKPIPSGLLCGEESGRENALI